MRFVIAESYAGLRMDPAAWRAGLNAVAISCLRIAVNDEAVKRYRERGADVDQVIEYLSYSTEYNDRLRRVLDVTGGWV